MSAERRGGVLAVATGSMGQIGLAAVANLATTTTLPPGERGRYVFLITALALSAPLAGLGSSVGLRRLLPHDDDPGALEKAYRRLTLLCALAHAVVATTVLAVLGVADAVRSAEDLAPVAVLAAGLVLNAQFIEHWFARSDFRTGAVYATANALAGLAAAGATVVVPTFQAAVWTQAVATLLINVTQLVHLTRHAGPSRGARRMRDLIRVGAPSLVLTSGIALTFRLDRIILGAVAGPVAVSVYSLAGSFSEMPRFVPASFGQVAYAQAARESGRTPVRPHVLRAYLWMVPAGVLTCSAGVIFIHQLDPVYLQAVGPLLVLVAAEYLLVPFNVVMRMILGGGRVGASAVVGGVAVVFSSVVYWFAIHRWGMYGAAGASLVVYGGVSVVCLLLYRSTKAKEKARESEIFASEHHNSTADRG